MEAEMERTNEDLGKLMEYKEKEINKLKGLNEVIEFDSILKLAPIEKKCIFKAKNDADLKFCIFFVIFAIL
jgi:hypothetical protein